MSKLPIEFCRHILDEINFVLKATSNLNYDQFILDEVLKRAVVRSLEIIGEAVKQIAPETKDLKPQIEWKPMAGLRDKLIHGYFGVDYAIVWDIVKSKLPTLKIQIADLITILSK